MALCVSVNGAEAYCILSYETAGRLELAQTNRGAAVDFGGHRAPTERTLYSVCIQDSASHEEELDMERFFFMLCFFLVDACRVIILSQVVPRECNINSTLSSFDKHLG